MMKNRIKEFRKQQKLTMQALAEKTGTTASQINKLEKGERRLTADWMYRLAAALDIHPTALFPHLGDEPPASTTKPLETKSTEAAAENNSLNIPVCNAQDVNEHWQIPRSTINGKGVQDIDPALVKVDQDEMEPDVSRGDYVLINRKDCRPAPAGIFVTQDKSRGHILQFCKNVEKDGQNFIQVTQIQREQGSDGQMQLTKKKMLLRPEQITLIGRVIAHWHWL